MSHTQEENQATETDPDGQMLNWVDNNFKAAVINMFKEFKKTRENMIDLVIGITVDKLAVKIQ